MRTEYARARAHTHTYTNTLNSAHAHPLHNFSQSVGLLLHSHPSPCSVRARVSLDQVVVHSALHPLVHTHTHTPLQSNHHRPCDEQLHGLDADGSASDLNSCCTNCCNDANCKVCQYNPSSEWQRALACWHRGSCQAVRHQIRALQ